MTQPTFDSTAVNDIATLGATAAKATLEPVPGLFILPNGQVVDVRDHIEKGQPYPDRKIGETRLTEAASFIAYVAKHGMDATELYGNAKNGRVTAIINAGRAADGPLFEGPAGWGDHQAHLNLAHTPDWKAWTTHDGEYRDQLTFAEFIEDHLPNFVEPTGADMLELAQSFNATTRVDFESSQRVKNGETQIGYRENTTASAGKTGSLTIPDTFTIGVQVHERGPLFRLTARFRYRIHEGHLRLAYKLNRPEDVLNAAFDAVVEEIQAATNREVWLT